MVDNDEDIIRFTRGSHYHNLSLHDQNDMNSKVYKRNTEKCQDAQILERIKEQDVIIDYCFQTDLKEQTRQIMNKFNKMCDFN